MDKWKHQKNVLEEDKTRKNSKGSGNNSSTQYCACENGKKPDGKNDSHAKFVSEKNDQKFPDEKYLGNDGVCSHEEKSGKIRKIFKIRCVKHLER